MSENKEQTGVIESMEQGARNASGPTATETVDGMKAGVLKMSEGQTVKDEPEHTEEVQISLDVLIEYHIFQDGKVKYRFVDKDGIKIETTQELKNTRNKAKYFYYDSANTQYVLTPTPLEIIKVEVNYRDNPNRLNKKIKYPENPDRIGGVKIYLVDFEKIISFRSDDGKVAFTARITIGGRNYFNDFSLASILGAMLNTGYTDFDYRGASSIEGGPGKSSSHINGYCADFGYLRNDKTVQKTHLWPNDDDGGSSWKDLDVERQNIWIDELKKFGWPSFLSWEYWKHPDTIDEWRKENIRAALEEKKASQPYLYTETMALLMRAYNEDMIGYKELLPTLKNITPYPDHYHHLHIQRWAPPIIEMEADNPSV